MLESQSWDESTNSQKGLLLEKNARLVQFKIIDNHLSKQSSTTRAHMQRSRLFILGVQWCDQFEQLWQASRHKYKCDKPQKSAAKPHKSDNEAAFVNRDEWKPQTEQMNDHTINHRCQLVHSWDGSKWKYEFWRNWPKKGKEDSYAKQNMLEINSCTLNYHNFDIQEWFRQNYDWRDYSIHLRKYLHTILTKLNTQIHWI